MWVVAVGGCLVPDRKDRRAAAIAWLQAQLGDTAPLEPTPEVFRRATLASVNALFDRIDRASFDRAVQVLRGARNVVIVGSGQDYMCATHLHHSSLTWFGNWHNYHNYASPAQHYMYDLTAADVVVTILTRPFDNQFLRIASYARKSGARVIAITDIPMSHLEPYVDEVLFVPIAATSGFKSYVSSAVLVEMLVVLAAANDGGTNSTESLRVSKRGRRRTHDAGRRSRAADIRS